MQVTHVKRYRRNNHRSRRQSTRKSRVISAVTSIGSFEGESIENTKESNSNNVNSIVPKRNVISIPSKSPQIKPNRPPTTASVIRVLKPPLSTLNTNQSHNQQQTISNNTQTPLHHITPKPYCTKMILDQLSKLSESSLSRVHPGQTSVSLSDFDSVNTKTPSRNSFLPSNNSHLIKQTISDQSVFDKNEKHNRETSYLHDLTEGDHHHRRRRRRFCTGFCPCCSPCCCLLAGLLLCLFLAGLATLITFITVSQTTTTITTITGTTGTTSTTTTSTAATTVTITFNACASSWKGITVFNFCTNCPDINSYQQYTYTYMAIATQTRITFALREDIGYFALDDISVRSTLASTVELLSNGGFETGSFSSWVYCNPAGSAYPGILKQTSDHFSAQNKNYSAHGGNYYYLDGAVGQADYLSQMFATNIGEIYNISFWLYNQGGGINSDANIIISI